MKILVLGGSYFLGKHFVQKNCKEHEITVFNRGSRPLRINGVKEITGDRHQASDFAELRQLEFDIVVDFCAYQPGDIAMIFEQLQGKFKQYVFISTCDVYERGLKRMLDENAPFENRDFGGEAGAYILGKAMLEKELVEQAEMTKIKYTSLRPAFIYGPENYAPREGIYFHWIKNAGQILHPTDADGEFQMVYVEDVVNAVTASLGNEAAYNESFNLAPLPMITYEMFASALEKSVGSSFEKVPVSLQMINENRIPLPFPLTREESNWYDGKKALELISSYTPLEEGLKKTAEDAGV